MKKMIAKKKNAEREKREKKHNAMKCGKGLWQIEKSYPKKTRRMLKFEIWYAVGELEMKNAIKNEKTNRRKQQMESKEINEKPPMEMNEIAEWTRHNDKERKWEIKREKKIIIHTLSLSSSHGTHSHTERQEKKIEKLCKTNLR